MSLSLSKTKKKPLPKKTKKKPMVGSSSKNLSKTKPWQDPRSVSHSQPSSSKSTQHPEKETLFQFPRQIKSITKDFKIETLKATLRDLPPTKTLRSWGSFIQIPLPKFFTQYPEED